MSVKTAFFSYLRSRSFLNSAFNLTTSFQAILIIPPFREQDNQGSALRGLTKYIELAE